jgi:hypothetical protein
MVFHFICFLVVRFCFIFYQLMNEADFLKLIDSWLNSMDRNFIDHFFDKVVKPFVMISFFLSGDCIFQEVDDDKGGYIDNYLNQWLNFIKLLKPKLNAIHFVRYHFFFMRCFILISLSF